MSCPALKPVPVALSPERQALADAIAAAGPRRAALDEARARAEAARGALAQAVVAGPAAERAAEEAKAYLIENPHGERATLRAARQAVADAADDLAIAREVSTRTDAAEVEAERSARYAAERVEAAASAVVAASFVGVVEAAERAARGAAGLAFAAIEVARNGDHWNGQRNEMMSRAEILNPHFAFGQDGNAAVAARSAAVAPWAAARAAMLTDPSAPLPAL